MISPITPNQAKEQKNKVIPGFVIDVFNQEILKNFNGNSARVIQKTVVKAILDCDSTLSAQFIFAEKWLDVEEIFRQVGWSVSYDNPAYNESYEPSWTFTKK